jgi:hypothetical protein
MTHPSQDGAAVMEEIPACGRDQRCALLYHTCGTLLCLTIPGNVAGLRLRRLSHFEMECAVDRRRHLSQLRPFAVQNSPGTCGDRARRLPGLGICAMICALWYGICILVIAVNDWPLRCVVYRSGLAVSTTIEVPMTRALVSTACLAMFCTCFCTLASCGALVDRVAEKVRVHDLECVLVRKRRHLMRRVRRRYRVRRRRSSRSAAFRAPGWDGSLRPEIPPACPELG